MGEFDINLGLTEDVNKALGKKISEIIDTKTSKLEKDFEVLKSLNPEIKKEDWETIKTQITKAATKEDFETAKAMAEEIGLEIKKMKEDSIKEQKNSMQKEISSMLIGNKEAIFKAISEKRNITIMSKSMKEAEAFSKKAATVETFGQDNITGAENYFDWHEGGAIGQIPTRNVLLQNLINVVSTAREFIKMANQKTVLRDAKNTAFCLAVDSKTKTEYSIDTLALYKVKDMTGICLDALTNFPFVKGEIENLLNTSFSLRKDLDHLMGNRNVSTDVNTPIDGITVNCIQDVAASWNPAVYSLEYPTVAADVANGKLYSGNIANGVKIADFTASVNKAQIIDLFIITTAIIKILGQLNAYTPNVALISPIEYTAIKLLKDDLGNYINRNNIMPSIFETIGNAMYIDGIIMVENPIIKQNTAYIFDSRKATIYQTPGFGIEYSFENNDNFEKEMATLKVWQKQQLLVRPNDYNSFMYISDIEAATDIINIPSAT